MPVGNGGGAIAIADTSDPALPSCASGNGASVRVIADAVGLKIENQRRSRRPTASDGRCARCKWSCIKESKAGIHHHSALYHW